MNSIEKLKRLTGENIKSAPEKSTVDNAAHIHQSSEKQSQLADLRRRIETVVTRSQTANKTAKEITVARGNAALAEIVPGEETENDYGKFFLISDKVLGGSRHGHRHISEASGFDMTAAAMLANNPGIAEFTCSDALFLDTETTGLAGGTGTMAFLIGLGWFEGGHFQVRQILARDFGEEAAALTYLAAIAGQKKFLVTFNGKAFDVNLLSTRFIMNRLEGKLSLLPHLDLLHPSRRILGHRLANSRLVTLETEVLGVEREGDIPGWEIPQRYFDWLRSRDPRLLAGIFEHNRLDVISMATLTAHLVDIMTAQAIEQHAHTDDYLAAARLLLNRRDLEGTVKILSMFHEQSCSDLSLQSKKRLAQLYKRTGRLSEAVQIWQDMAACGPLDFYAVSELAKWLEHKVCDCNQAKMLVENALHQDNTFSQEEKESLLHRLKRLNAKVGDGG